MNTEQYKYILAVAEYKSFSKAAENLFVTQPYLSKLVSSIENELGTQLFERSHNAFTITPAGKCYLEFIQNHLLAEQKMRARISEIASSKTVKLKLGITSAHGSYILPQLLEKFCLLYPGIHLTLEEHNNQTLLDYILNSAVDLCCFSSPEYHASLAYDVIECEKILMVLPPSHPLGHVWAKGNFLSPRPFPKEQLGLLSYEKFVILSKSQGMGRYAREIFEKYDIHPDIVMETKNIETAYRLAAAGIGITFIPQICTGFSNFENSPYYYSVGDPPLERKVVIAYRKDRELSEVERNFIELAKNLSPK